MMICFEKNLNIFSKFILDMCNYLKNNVKLIIKINQ